MIFAISDWTISHTVVGTILSSLGVAALVAVSLGLVLLFCRKASAVVRYRITAAGLWISVIASIAACVMIMEHPSVRLFAGIVLDQLKLTSTTLVGIITSIWLFGVAFFIARLIMGLLQLHWLTQQAMPSQILFGRNVRLVDTGCLSGPVVVGWLRPCMLVPTWCMDRLDFEDFECLLRHEQAHVERRDFFFNILQRAVAGLLWFHPAVWWMLARIRVEREHCCDESVVHSGVEQVHYARALATLATTRPAKETLAMSADSEIVSRIRLLSGGSAVPVGKTLFATAMHSFVFALVLSAVFSASQWQAAQLQKNSAKELNLDTLCCPSP